MGKPDHTLYVKAAQAYQKHCEVKGIPHRVPSEPLATMGWRWVTLRDNQGILAKYNRWTGEVVDNSGE